MENITVDQARKLRVTAQKPIRSGVKTGPQQVLQAILAVQAQDLPSGYLSIRARGSGVTLEQLKRVHWDQRELSWSWSLRGTLHLVTSEDLRWLIPLLGPDLILRDRTRMAQLGWTEETARQGVRLVVDLLKDHGDLSRAEIAAQLSAHGLPYVGQATMHLLFRAVCEGHLTTTGIQSNRPIYGLFENQHSALEKMDKQSGLIRLARRYLQAYAPAAVEDFAYWSGIKMSDARSTWEKIQKETVDISVEGRIAQMLEEQIGWLASVTDLPPALQFLPRWDTYLLGYAKRDWLIDPVHEQSLYPGGGIIAASIVLDGKIIGYWNLIHKKPSLRLDAVVFEKPQRNLEDMIEAEAADIGRFYDRNVILAVSTIEYPL